ncbi:FtsX-like permease family protein [Streptomyces sp. NPDC008150]|uniref:FtsX-like permease family protein n=1 Tax=Streptomyces sp. NPDC008150 TaxID=3364816 RepID=UPI0036EA0571
MTARQWSRDLSMGLRFAFSGGREGWIRVVLTAVGVGLGVALLLVTTAVPHALAARTDRADDRMDRTMLNTAKALPRSDRTVLVADVDTTYRDKDVYGRELEPEGADAPLPPGVDAFPAPGEMVVSPALRALLDSADGELLRQRLPDRVVGTIGGRGLLGSRELAFYRGTEGLAAKLGGQSVIRIDRFGEADRSGDGLDPVLLLLTLVVFVVLLTPVCVFVATAVRFGGDRRDRRLAALRLVGADSATARRIAAGEALAGAVLGLLCGAACFLGCRRLADRFELFGLSVLPGDLDPSAALVLLVAVCVPAAAVAVTLLAMRRVVVEPLGVVRTARPARRRLWWRLLLPVAGLGLLATLMGRGTTGGNFNQYQVSAGVVLLLAGVTVLLPWVVDAVVTRLGSGGVAWQLAVRRLQLSGSTASRMVNGIAVAVAGAIALQMLFTGVEPAYTSASPQDLTRAQMQVSTSRGVSVAQASAEFAATKGVDRVYAYAEGMVADRPDADSGWSTLLTVGDCAALRTSAKLPSCHDGDVFTVRGEDVGDDTEALAERGHRVYLDPYDTLAGSEAADASLAWTLPRRVKRAVSVMNPVGEHRGGLLVTPGALPGGAGATLTATFLLRVDDSVADVHDRVRNTAARVDPLARTAVWSETDQSHKFASIRTGLLAGAACVLTLIGASLLVSQLEQLRERRRLLSALVAFGTRRRTLTLSVLWQTAIPVALGLALAMLAGLALGAVLLRMADERVSVDWASVLAMTGIGAGVVLAVTLLSLPPLLRLMRPDGLRTE